MSAEPTTRPGGTVVTVTHPYTSVTRTTYALANGQTVTVDVSEGRDEGRIALSEGNLGLLSFTHRNPVGAGITLVQTIESALATTVEA